MANRGLFIAIEGGDGSGKGTQSELLQKYYTDELGLDVLNISFPRHGNDSAYYADRYLDGAYGENPDDIPADLASLAYAIDRFAAGAEIRNHLKKPNSVVIADRYVASNLAHQGAKLTNPDKRRAYYKHMMQTEYDILGIPKPSKNIVLLVPTDIAQANISKKSARNYTIRTHDIHEADANHLDKAKANYEELCHLYPDEFTAIDCIDDNGKMRSIDDIQMEIRNLIKI